MDDGSGHLIILCPSEKWSWATWRRMPTYTDHQWTLTKLRSSLYLPTGNDLWGTEILLSNITLRWANRTATKTFQFSKIQHNLLPLLVNNIWATWLAKGGPFFYSYFSFHPWSSVEGLLLRNLLIRWIYLYSIVWFFLFLKSSNRQI